MLYDAKLSQVYAARMREEGIYVTGFYYPLNRRQARITNPPPDNKEHLVKCTKRLLR